MAIQFPNSPGIGSVFTDTDSGFSYEWTGVVWKSFTAAAASNIKTLDDISSSFDNSTTAFNLTIAGASYTPQNAAMLQISLGGVIQEPGTDYTVSLDTITFTTAPNVGLDFFGVVRGTAVAIDFANDGNVQTKQEFTATEGQTSFTVTGGYRTGYVDVFRNGVRLGSDDFTDTSGTAIVLTVAAQADDLIEVVKYNVASLVVSQGEFTNINVTGIVTASSFEGDGSSLSGIDATALKDSAGGSVKVQANTHGAVVTGILTGSNAKFTGIVTATTFVGNLTGNVTGDVTGNADTATNATGLSGSPTIAITNLTGVAATFTGNVTIGGTLTYQDVENIDSVGIITAQQGIQVLANGLDVTGIGTFEDRLTYDGSLGQAGGAQVDYAVTVATKDSTHRYNGTGSGNGYVIDNLQAPVLTLTPGRTYFFDQSDSTNSGHPLRFYLEADKTTQYTTNVTAGSISAGTAGAGVTIVIGDSTPNVLHYQCSSHSYMGNSAINQSNIAGGLIGTPDITVNNITGAALTATSAQFSGNVSIADSIFHTGDTDTAVRFPSANTVTVETAGSERLRIDSRGSFQFSNGFMNETVKINTTARTGTQAVNLDEGMVHYFSTNSAGTWKPNFTMSAGDDINATIAIGDVFSPTMIVAKGADTHFANSAEVDGTTIASIEFLGGAPTDGGASGTFDIYTYSIIKTGDDAFKAFVAVSTYE